MSRTLVQIDTQLRSAQSARQIARQHLAEGTVPVDERPALADRIKYYTERIENLLAERSQAMFEREIASL